MWQQLYWRGKSLAEGEQAVSYCYSTLQEVEAEGFTRRAVRLLRGDGKGSRFPHRLNFSHTDLSLPVNTRKAQRQSISGVQDKVLLDLVGDDLQVVDNGGNYILKPKPSNPYAEFLSDIPANEHVTMQIAGQIFGINVAVNSCIRFNDGELAYITRRFDRRDGLPILQEDLCQLMGRTEETHGENYKYDASYEEMVDTVKAYCPTRKIALFQIFYRLLFNYVFANGDAHLKNFSFCQGESGDYILSPAYDLLNTLLHFQNELGRTALDMFRDDYMTPEYEKLGYYTEIDFIRLGAFYGVPETGVLKMIATFHAARQRVEDMIQRSFLSDSAKQKYLEIFHDRLMAFRGTAI